MRTQLPVKLSEGSDSITLERKAMNLKQDVDVRNTKNINGPKLILFGRPISYKSTLPLERIFRSLNDRNIPVTMSDDAGKYICNYRL
jgi:pyrrolidone-carboxylate peptidase